MTSLLVLNGPNLNMLGRREPGVYGNDTLDAIVAQMSTRAAALGCEIDFFQSNAEFELIERIQTAQVDCIIINPGAFTHTSIALRDAFLAVNIPFVEVHLSNIHNREPFRKHSYLSDVAVGCLFGFGAHGYILALEAAVHHVSEQGS